MSPRILLATVSTACLLSFSAIAAPNFAVPTAPEAAPVEAPAPAPVAADTDEIKLPVHPVHHAKVKKPDATTAAAATPAKAPPAPAAPGNNAPVTHAELEALVRQTLMEHPEIIMESVQKAQAKEEAAAQVKAQASLKQHRDELIGDASSPAIGPKNADVTLVEFFDYHCGYCKHLLPSIVQLSQEDKHVRVIFKEFPILAEDSTTAARAALAVNRIAPDKYFAFHQELMKSNGKFDEKMLADTAAKLGIDPAQLKAEMAKPRITAELDKDRKMGEELGIRGTPALVIGDKLYPGAVPYDQMKKFIADARSGKKPDAPVAN